MRKISITMTTLLMAILMCLSTLLGCNLITTNYERDMNQVIATIKIDESAPKKVIYKKDLISSYINHTSSDNDHNHSSDTGIFDEIVDELVNDAVFVQYAMQYFANNPTELDNGGVAITEENKWDVETYLNADEFLDAIYYTHQDINYLLEDYIDQEEEISDTFSGTVRVVPTGAQNDTEKPKDKKEAYANIDANNPYGHINVDEPARRKAFVKVVNMLEENDILGDDYKNGNLETTDYFKQVLESYQEDELLNKFEIAVNKKARQTITYDDVQEEYARLYDLQKEYTKTEFETALGDAFTAQSPILYGREGYGTVYHVLLKASTKMTDALTEWKEEKNVENGAYMNAEYSAKRAELFKDITAKDQRDTWIKAGYDFNGTHFTGDYALYEDSLQFFGDVYHLNADDATKDDYRAKYRVDKVNEMSLEDILDLINDYLYNGTANIPADLGNIDSVTYKATTVNEGYNNRIRELMFAFSQDDSTSALNTYKGYVIKPQPDADEKDDWMLEFAEEGRKLIKEDNKTFKVVATDYGYHIMFFGENFNPTKNDMPAYDFPTLESFLNHQFDENKPSWEDEYSVMMNNWEEYEDTDSYLYVLINSLSSTAVNKAYKVIEQEVLRDYVYNSKVVKKYKDAYKDLIEE